MLLNKKFLWMLEVCEQSEIFQISLVFLQKMVRDICAVCNEQIHRKKVCPLCLTDEIELWLERNKVSLIKDFRLEVQKFLVKVKRYYKMTCDICRSDTETAICSNCFTGHIVAWLKLRGGETATDFTKNFRYDTQTTQRDLYA